MFMLVLLNLSAASNTIGHSILLNWLLEIGSEGYGGVVVVLLLPGMIPVNV